jgi:hypothetical protein
VVTRRLPTHLFARFNLAMPSRKMGYNPNFDIGYLTSLSGDLPNHCRQNPEVGIV